MDLIGLLVAFAVLCVLYWAVHRIGGAAGLSPMIMVIIDVVLVIVFLIVLINALGYGGSLGLRR